VGDPASLVHAQESSYPDDQDHSNQLFRFSDIRFDISTKSQRWRIIFEGKCTSGGSYTTTL
jgi:hypothetical protein